MEIMQCDKFTYEERIALSILSTTPIKSKELGARMGTKDAETRQIIRELRMKGVKVCSGADGFWIWNGKDDSWMHTQRQIYSRVKSLLELLKAMKKEPNDEQLKWGEM